MATTQIKINGWYIIAKILSILIDTLIKSPNFSTMLSSFNSYSRRCIYSRIRSWLMWDIWVKKEVASQKCWNPDFYFSRKKLNTFFFHELPHFFFSVRISTKNVSHHSYCFYVLFRSIYLQNSVMMEIFSNTFLVWQWKNVEWELFQKTSSISNSTKRSFLKYHISWDFYTYVSMDKKKHIG